MTLTLELPPELERRLAEEAAREGRDIESFAISVLRDRVVGGAVQRPGDERTPEQIIADSFARFPPGSPQELAALMRRHGAPVFTSVKVLVGEEPLTDEEFDVDAFVEARRRWKWEGRPSGAGLADIEDAER